MNEVPQKTLQKIYVPAENNPVLKKTLELINNNEELKTLWEIVNVNAMERLGMSDHGPVHVQIVANSSLKIARLLHKHGIEMSVTTGFGLSHEYAEVVLLLASLCHDLGMTISRKGHEEFSLFLANSLLRELLVDLSHKEKAIVISETLHAIISHRSDGRPLTIEAGILRVADALDMTEGRSRIPYEAEIVNIHSISAVAIDQVRIIEGASKPIQIEIVMNNSAGIFQVDELLKQKLAGSGIEKYIAVRAYVDREDEKKLLNEFIF
jgi:metal-dependent HD superfamily phosphatase/phosphodiesterase